MSPKLRQKATLDFTAFEPRLLLLLSTAKCRHTRTVKRGKHGWQHSRWQQTFERRSTHLSSKMDLRRMLPDAKEPPAGPPRHEARQAAQSSLLCHQLQRLELSLVCVC